MKMKIADALNANLALAEFGKTALTFSMSMIVAKNARALQDVADEYEKRRVALIDKYGEPDEKNGGKIVTKANNKIFSDEINAITNEIISVGALKTIDSKKLPVDYVVQPNILMFLQWMFKP